MRHPNNEPAVARYRLAVQGIDRVRQPILHVRAAAALSATPRKPPCQNAKTADDPVTMAESAPDEAWIGPLSVGEAQRALYRAL
ncbi:hypothetical protein GCM10009810_30480 [Nostocoides vanveenii]|uniref:Uncharacterized protein n=1 Tax=Nostocoides vanveenii TaxID=330835 RepID=A0ABN2KYT1_9MICO